MKEGSVVVCPNKSKVDGGDAQRVGTIVMLVNGECLVLDGEGFIHQVSTREIYLYQGD